MRNRISRGRSGGRVPGQWSHAVPFTPPPESYSVAPLAALVRPYVRNRSAGMVAENQPSWGVPAGLQVLLDLSQPVEVAA